MLTIADLELAFSSYFEEMDRCVACRCYLALLHMLVTLPDVCAALQSTSGEAGDGGPYERWCKENFAATSISGHDRYPLRCALLHQGRSAPKHGRYVTYSCVQPSPPGDIVHRFSSSDRNLTLDVSVLTHETRAAIQSCFAKLQLS